MDNHIFPHVEKLVPTHRIHDTREVLEKVFSVIFRQIDHFDGSANLTEEHFERPKTKTSCLIFLLNDNGGDLGVRK
jgi:hypothetical protein